MKKICVQESDHGVYRITLDQKALPVARIAEAIVGFRIRHPGCHISAILETTGVSGIPMLVIVTNPPYGCDVGRDVG